VLPARTLEEAKTTIRLLQHALVLDGLFLASAKRNGGIVDLSSDDDDSH